MFVPEIKIYRGDGLSWPPTWTEETNFLRALRVREAGNYGVTALDITMKNVSAGMRGTFTNSLFGQYLDATDYLKLSIDDGVNSKVFYGRWGSWEAQYTATPPTEVTYKGKDLREETVWRGISMDFAGDDITTQMAASKAITYMFTNPDDAATGANPLTFVLSMSSDGAKNLNSVDPKSNYANQHPTIFKAYTEMLQDAGYEHEFCVGTNNSKVIAMWPAGQTYWTVGGFYVCSTNNVSNNVADLQYLVNYDDIANVIGVFGNKIERYQKIVDEWTEDATGDSAWSNINPLGGNFSCTVLVGEPGTPIAQIPSGLESTRIVTVWREFEVFPNATNMTVGCTISFPAYSEATRLTLTKKNAVNIRFKVSTFYPYPPPNHPKSAYDMKLMVQLKDNVGNVIENVDVVESIIPTYLVEGGNIAKATAYYVFNWQDIDINGNARAADGIATTETPGYPWYFRNGTNFSWDDIASITFYANAPTVHWLGFFLDMIEITADIPISPRESPTWSLIDDPASISLYGRRYKPYADNRLKSTADVAAAAADELDKYDIPVRRMRIKVVPQLAAKIGHLCLLESPIYDITPANSNQIWRLLQSEFSWRAGSQLEHTMELIYPATPSSPSQDILALKKRSMDRMEALSAVIEELYDKVKNYPTTGTTVAGGGINEIVNNPPPPNIPTTLAVTDLLATNASVQTMYGDAWNVSNFKMGVASALGVYAQSAGLNNIVASTFQGGNVSVVFIHAQSALFPFVSGSGATFDNFSTKTLYSQATNSSTALLGVASALGFYGQSASLNNIIFSTAIGGVLSSLGIYTQSASIDNLVASTALLGVATIGGNLSVAGSLTVQSRINTFNMSIVGVYANSASLDSLVFSTALGGNISANHVTANSANIPLLVASTIGAGVVSSLGLYAQSTSTNNLVFSTGFGGNLSVNSLVANSASIPLLTTSSLLAGVTSSIGLYGQSASLNNVVASTLLFGVTSTLGIYAQSASLNNLVASTAKLGVATVAGNLSVGGSLTVQSQVTAFNTSFVSMYSQEIRPEWLSDGERRVDRWALLYTEGSRDLVCRIHIAQAGIGSMYADGRKWGYGAYQCAVTCASEGNFMYNTFIAPFFFEQKHGFIDEGCIITYQQGLAIGSSRTFIYCSNDSTYTGTEAAWQDFNASGFVNMKYVWSSKPSVEFWNNGVLLGTHTTGVPIDLMGLGIVEAGQPEQHAPLQRIWCKARMPITVL